MGQKVCFGLILIFHGLLHIQSTIGRTDCKPKELIRPIYSPTDYHRRMIEKISAELNSEGFKKLKYLCEAHIKPAELKNVADFSKLVAKLEEKKIVKIGEYSKLVGCFETMKLPELVKIIKQCEYDCRYEAN